MYESKICLNCSPKRELVRQNHKRVPHKDIHIWECCQCRFKTYFTTDGQELSKEEVFEKYPELLEERKNRIAEAKKHINCKCASKVEEMWCYNKPWITCEVKTIMEELYGRCTNPISAKEQIDEILKAHPEVLQT